MTKQKDNGGNTMAVIGFIGMGNMGYAIMKGLLKVYSKEDILFTDVNKARMEQVGEETGVRYVESNGECANQVKYLVLAVKPQYYDGVLDQIRNIVTREHVIISIAPGISIEQLKKKLGVEKRIVRAMPNTPALLGEGMTGVCYQHIFPVFWQDEDCGGAFNQRCGLRQRKFARLCLYVH